ncbi:hypothetical protein, partial [Raoultella terrigena]|uniref:hypothetical protein n=1 Tax=Raoultella terrigena TaxID=577 RepID=UPI001C70AC0C
SSFRVKRLFCFSLSAFAADIQRWSLLTRRPVSRCSVSVEAHYREFSDVDKPCLQKTFQPPLFSPKRVAEWQKTGVLPF